MAALASLDVAQTATELPFILELVRLSLEVFAAALSDHAANRLFVASEGLYSMLGESLFRAGLVTDATAAPTIAR